MVIFRKGCYWSRLRPYRSFKFHSELSRAYLVKRHGNAGTLLVNKIFPELNTGCILSSVNTGFRSNIWSRVKLRHPLLTKLIEKVSRHKIMTLPLKKYALKNISVTLNWDGFWKPKWEEMTERSAFFGVLPSLPGCWPSTSQLLWSIPSSSKKPYYSQWKICFSISGPLRFLARWIARWSAVQPNPSCPRRYANIRSQDQ
jgi:hypothetical protein